MVSFSCSSSYGFHNSSILPMTRRRTAIPSLIAADLRQFRRQRVNLRQVCIILSVLQYGKVDSGKFFTYLLEMRAIAAVAANVYLPSGQGDAGNGG